MIVIKSVEYAGGACPYQIEATTEDGKYFYLRYRGGRLRACVSETHESFLQSASNYNVIDIPFGDEMAGYAYHDDIYPLLESVIKFPVGFKIESYPKK
jgi:hypothetical protein